MDNARGCGVERSLDGDGASSILSIRREKLVVTTPWGTPVGFGDRQTRGILTWVKDQ